MIQITPYLNFDGQCREAMTFYQECFGGELQLQKVSESPMAARMPSEAGAHILHSCLFRDGMTIMGSDDLMHTNIKKGNSLKLCINCSSDKEINTLFTKLSTGGEIKTPLHQSFWGATFG